MSMIPSIPVVSFRVENAQQLERWLTGLSSGMARNMTRRALRIGGRPMLDAIRGRAPRQTGLLAAKLRLRAGRGDREGRVSMLISATATREEFAASRENAGRSGHGPQAARVRRAGSGTDRYAVYYGALVEQGHKGPYGSDQKTPAHPFAGPSFDATVDQTAQRIEEELWNQASRYDGG